MDDNNDITKKPGQLRSYAVFLAGMFFLLVGVNILVYIREFYAGLIMTCGLIVYLIVIQVFYYFKKKKALQDLIDFASAYSCLQNKLMEKFAFPYFLLDKEGKLLWFNKKFEELDGEVLRCKGRPITEILPEITPAMLPKTDYETNFHIEHKDTKFRVNIKEITEGNRLAVFSFPDIKASALKRLYAVTLFDETQLRDYMKKYEDETMVTALLYIDNYEEALESVEEVSRSILTALIDRKINQYFNGFDCIVRKFEKDKYLILMRTSAMKEMGENRFAILEEIKEINNTYNDISVTMSIGIGSAQGSYVKNLEAARICIDLALGRGGDQVVIKNVDSIQYFGGKTQAVEKSTKVKARVKAHALREFMAVSEKIIVMGHKRIDIDAFGAAIGIFRAAHTINKKVHIVVDYTSAALSPFIGSFRNDSSYDDDMFVSCEKAKDIINDKTLLIVVDTSKPGYTCCEDLLYMTKNIVVFDHHRQSSDVIKNSMLSYIEPYASSSCEMVAEILQYFADNLKIKNIEADAMYAGMVIDTDNFVQKTGVRTFEAAAYLRRHGADVTRVRKMFREDMTDYLAKGEVIRNVRLFKEHFAISVCPAEGLEQPMIVGAQAANELLNIIGVRASFVLTKYNGTVFISARAIDEVNVQLIMERIGGGGHMNIAGAQLTNLSIEAAEAKLKQVLTDMIDGGEL